MLKILFIIMAMTAWADTAYADDASPDKSGYTLFNPVPDELMREFSTDRPSKSNSPNTVDAGHFQYEGDILSWTYDRYTATHTTSSSLQLFDPTFKLGLTENTDLEMALAPININQMTDRTIGEHNGAFGFGDVYTRVKWNLFGNEGGDYALAIVPFIKLPSADQHIGNGHWEGGGYAPFSITLFDKWTATLQTEFDVLENAALDGRHMNYQNLINLTRPITDTVTGEIEFWSDVDTDAGAATQYTFDLSAYWSLPHDLQFDAGTNIGLNKAAPDLQLYAGISKRF